MTKNNFIFYADYMEDLQELDPVDFRTILMAMTCYQTGEELPEMDSTLRCLFRVLCRRIDRDNEAYENTCTRNRENGSKGGRPKKIAIPKNKENPTKPKETQNNPEKPNHNPTKPKKPELDIGYRNMSISSPTDVVEDIPREQQPLPELNDYTAGIIKTVWNKQEVTRNVDAIPIFGTRANNTRLCIGSDFGSFIALIKDLDNQYFFKNRDRPVDYDWFVNPDHYLAIKEGKYKDKYNDKGGYTGELTIDWEALERDSSELPTGTE